MLTARRKGHGKRTPLRSYRILREGGKGVQLKGRPTDKGLRRGHDEVNEESDRVYVMLITTTEKVEESERQRGGGFVLVFFCVFSFWGYGFFFCFSFSLDSRSGAFDAGGAAVAAGGCRLRGGGGGLQEESEKREEVTRTPFCGRTASFAREGFCGVVLPLDAVRKASLHCRPRGVRG